MTDTGLDMAGLAGHDAHRRLADLSRVWNVELDRVEETAGSVIGFGWRRGEPVVLKAAAWRHDEWDAGEVVSAFGGHGMVRALERTTGAVLLEAVRPGTQLVELVVQGREPDANRAFIGVIERMSAAEADTQRWSSAEDRGVGFDGYASAGHGHVPQEFVAEARAVYMELCRSQRNLRLLHGDLQHYNVLWSEERGWVAIDPKGVVAEVAFELGAILRNPTGAPELHERSSLRRRVHQLAEGLGIEATRVAAWAFAQSVLSAIWIIEDEGESAPIAPMLRVARNLRYLVS